MPKVRDRTKHGYKGRPTEASSKDCPCCSCYSPHDCGRIGHKGWIVDMRCLTRDNHGCPRPDRPPVHFVSKRYGRICDRCGLALTGEDLKEAKANYERGEAANS